MNDLATLLMRNLSEVFGEADSTRRQAAIAELFTRDCVLCTPNGRFVGPEALDRVAGRLRGGHPAYAYTPLGAPQTVFDGGRLAWTSGPPEEPARYSGVDFAISREGRIAVLYVFLDSEPS